MVCTQNENKHAQDGMEHKNTALSCGEITMTKFFISSKGLRMQLSTECLREALGIQSTAQGKKNAIGEAAAWWQCACNLIAWETKARH